MYRMLSRYIRVKMPFYAVRKGRKPGIYATWSECEAQVNGFAGARFKKFAAENEALSFVEGTDGSVSQSSSDPIVENAISNTSVESSDSTRSNAVSLDHAKFTSHSNSKPTGAKKRSAILLSFDEVVAKKSKSDSVAVYTDGCCLANGKGNPRAGLGVYWGPGHPNNLAERLTGRQTNNRAEIFAVVRALQQAKADGISEIVIYTDSQFLINCQTKWVSKWKSNGWKSSNGSKVINRDELELLCAEETGIKVNYEYVKGHAGVEGNEEADKLANLGAAKDLESSCDSSQ